MTPCKYTSDLKIVSTNKPKCCNNGKNCNHASDSKTAKNIIDKKIVCCDNNCKNGSKCSKTENKVINEVLYKRKVIGKKPVKKNITKTTNNKLAGSKTSKKITSKRKPQRKIRKPPGLPKPLHCKQVNSKIGKGSKIQNCCDIEDEDIEITRPKYKPIMNLPFEKSFAFHEKSKYFSSKNNIDPKYIARRTHYYFLFNCPDCKHEVYMSPDKICSGNWCTVCAHFDLCGNCDDCYNKSFASHDMVKYWSSKNTIDPKLVFIRSRRSYIFDCPKCKHESLIALSSISKCNKYCAYCYGSKLCDDDECDFCFEKSFASYIDILAKKKIYWSEKNLLKPRQLRKFSNKKFCFECKNGKIIHVFNAILCDISAGNGCSQCCNKTESYLYDTLKDTYPDLILQFKKKWCKKKFQLPFDFCLLKYKIIIELDGRQHFQQVSNWDSPIKAHENDLFKMKCANDNEFRVIRLLQSDVYFNKNDWLNKLKNEIKILSKTKEIKNIFICGNNEYNIFKKGTTEYDVIHLLMDGYKELNTVSDFVSQYKLNTDNTDTLFAFLKNSGELIKGRIVHKIHDKHRIKHIIYTTPDDDQYSIKFENIERIWILIPDT